MSTDIIKLKAKSYSEACSNSIVINAQQFDYFFWIELDPEEVRNAYMYEVTEIDEAGPRPVLPNSFVRESTSWIKVTSSLVNKSPGLHMYKISFADKYTDVTFSKYIAYTAQTDNPEKPYLYMNRPLEERRLAPYDSNIYIEDIQSE